MRLNSNIYQGSILFLILAIPLLCWQGCSRAEEDPRNVDGLLEAMLKASSSQKDSAISIFQNTLILKEELPLLEAALQQMVEDQDNPSHIGAAEAVLKKMSNVGNDQTVGFLEMISIQLKEAHPVKQLIIESLAQINSPRAVEGLKIMLKEVPAKWIDLDPIATHLIRQPEHLYLLFPEVLELNHSLETRLLVFRMMNEAIRTNEYLEQSLKDSLVNWYDQSVSLKNTFSFEELLLGKRTVQLELYLEYCRLLLYYEQKGETQISMNTELFDHEDPMMAWLGLTLMKAYQEEKILLSQEQIARLAEIPIIRNTLRKALYAQGQAALFPESYLKQRYVAESEFIQGLVINNEAKTDQRFKLLSTFLDKEEEDSELWYVFILEGGKEDRRLGVCGPIPADTSQFTEDFHEIGLLPSAWKGKSMDEQMRLKLSKK